MQTLTCRSCGLSFQQSVSVAEHRYTETVAKAATCAEEGILTQQCAVCGASEDAPLPLADHAFDFFCGSFPLHCLR